MELIPGCTYEIDYVQSGVNYNRVGVFSRCIYNAVTQSYYFCFNVHGDVSLVLHVSDDVRIRPLKN